MGTACLLWSSFVYHVRRLHDKSLGFPLPYAPCGQGRDDESLCYAQVRVCACAPVVRMCRRRVSAGGSCASVLLQGSISLTFVLVADFRPRRWRVWA